MRANPPVLHGALPARFVPSVCKSCGDHIAAGDAYYQQKLPYRSHFGDPERYHRKCYERGRNRGHRQ